MCGALASAGAANEKWPPASLLVLATSCMPCDSESSLTSSPTDGLPVVALVTLPVMFCAAAKELKAKMASPNHAQVTRLMGAVLKGHGFSRAVRRCNEPSALAAEGIRNVRPSSGAKAPRLGNAFTAQLKLCPFKTMRLSRMLFTPALHPAHLRALSHVSPRPAPSQS